MSRVHVGGKARERAGGRPDSLIGCDCLSLSNSVGERGTGPAASSLTPPLWSATLTGEEAGSVARWRAELLLCVCVTEKAKGRLLSWLRDQLRLKTSVARSRLHFSVCAGTSACLVDLVCPA